MRIRTCIAFSLAASLIAFVSAVADSGDDLRRAINLQDVSLLKQLLSQGADPNVVVDDRPVLGWAAQAGNPEIVRLLLEAKADVNVVDRYSNETPLLRAVEQGKPEVVQELLKAKPNLEAKNRSGETALAMAVKGESAEMVQALIQAGANVSYSSEDGDTLALLAAQASNSASPEIISLLAKAKADLNTPNLVYSPLYYAVEVGNAATTKALLDGGADPNKASGSGRPPLYAAINSGEITELLIRAKANPNYGTEDGSPLLISAIENGSDEAVKALINGGANVNAHDTYGNSALTVAKNYAKNDIVEALKAKGASE